MLINDDECDTEYPELLDNDMTHPSPQESSADITPSTLMYASIHVARLMSPIAKLFKSLCITNETLIRFEGHLRACVAAFPKPLQLDSGSPIDPRLAGPLISFQNIRLLLYRHNLSPSCSPEQRSQAVDLCVSSARDTAQVISRCMMSDGLISESEAQHRFALSATTMVCTHIWRSMLILLFKPLDDAFLALLRAASLIGNAKTVNLRCGRYLSFCLRSLVEKLEAGSNLDFEQDEEVVVYLSGDLQASTGSWVWGNAETGTHLSRRQKHGRLKSAQEQGTSMASESYQSSSWDSVLSAHEQQDWGGWQTVEQGARYLRSLQEKRLQMVQNYPHDRPVSILPRITTSDEQSLRPPQTGTSLPPISPSSQSQSSTDTSKDTKSRMTIASLMK